VPGSASRVVGLSVLVLVVSVAAVAAGSAVPAATTADTGGRAGVASAGPTTAADTGGRAGVASAGPTTAAGVSPSSPAVEIAAVYPNPARHEDRGEFVVLRVRRPTDLAEWTLADDRSAVALGAANATVEGRVAVTAHPGVVRNLTASDAVRVDRVLAADLPRLSNAGERVALRRGTETVDAVEYGDAPERSLYAGGWRHLDATNRSPLRVGPRSVRAFVLPDGADVPGAVLRSAERRVLLAGYTFESERAVAALEDAAARGVTVRVLVDAGPVGGVSRRQARLLDRLANTSGISVWAYGTEGAPYAYHHAKYAVVDDETLVTTENWKPGGLGGAGSRGWGAVVAGERVAAELTAVFEADASRPAAAPWEEYRTRVDPVYGSVDRGSFPERVGPERLRADAVRVLLAPDNAEGELVDVVRGANRSVWVQQVSMERGPLLSATVDAARRGAEVRVLLSGARYTREENRRLARTLNDRADREGWDLEVRLADGEGFETVHTKGAVVDDRVVLGSLNWNDHSAARNREVVLVLSGAGVADYYREAFETDWQGGGERTGLPMWVVLAALAAAVLAVAVGYRRVQFAVDRT